MIVEVRAAPGSRRFSLSRTKDGMLKVSLESPPENNRANAELVRELSLRLGAEVRILSGHSSHRKRLLINVSEDLWNAFLASL